MGSSEQLYWDGSFDTAVNYCDVSVYDWKAFPNVIPRIKDIQKDRNLRNQRYEILDQLFDGEHATVFRIPLEKRAKYVVINFLRKVSKVVADGLAKNPPSYILQSPENQTFIEEIVFDSSLDTKLFEMALASSCLGDTFIGLTIDGVESSVEDINGNLKIIQADYNYLIDYIDPRTVDIITDPFNKTLIRQFIVDGHYEDPQLKKNVYKRIIHDKNTITYEIYEGKDASAVDPEKLISKKVFTHNLNRFFIVHIPNFRKSGMLYGDTDYVEAMHLQMEINNRITQLIIVFDKHGEPKMLMSSETFDSIFSGEDVKEDSQGNKFVNMGELEVIRVEGKDEKIEMLTWDGKTTDSLELLKFNVNQLLAITETSPELLGSSQTGGSVGESGYALKMRLIPTENKIERLKKYFDLALKDLLYTAQLFEVEYATEKDIQDAEKVNIEWKSFYPQDEKLQTDIAVALKNNEIVDLETLLKSTLGYNQEHVTKIIDNLQKEKQAKVNTDFQNFNTTLASNG